MEEQRLLVESGRSSLLEEDENDYESPDALGDQGDGINFHALRARRENDGASFEEAVAVTGYGRFHVILLLVCGWAVSSDAIEILGISFILPPATCDLGLSDSDKGWMNSSVFLGMMIGGLFWGTLSDLRGRRSVLLWSLSVNAIGGLASSFAHTTTLFVICRLISGIGVGGSMPVIFAYFCEFQAKERRGSAISMLATFWMTGNIVAAALAWAIIPLEFYVTLGSGYTYNSWRLYLALCTLPSATSVLTYVLMPESPKYLLQNGYEQKALVVFQRMYVSNMKLDNPSLYPYKSLIPETPVNTSHGRSRGDSYIKSIFQSVAQFCKSLSGVFAGDLFRRSVVMVIIYFTLSFGFYGLFMWLPELFQRIDTLGGNPCQTSNNSTANTGVNCSVSSHVFFEGFMTALANLPGNLLTILLIDRVGRKILLSLSMIISGVCVYMLYLVNSSTAALVMSCLFSGVSVIGWNALDVLQAEIYPTNARSTASGLLMAVGRIASILANLIFGFLIGLNCAIPMTVVSILLFVGGLSAIFLPNMTNQDLL